MAQTAAHAYISVLLRKKFSYRKWFFPAFLLGSILPDIDYFFSKIHEIANIPSYLSFLNKTFAHSIISPIIIYLLLLIVHEIKKDKNIIHLANGLIIGLFLHISIDILFFLEKIDLFWPLPIKAIYLIDINIPTYIYKSTLALEFVFFRWFAYYAINMILHHPGKNKNLIKIQTCWMKIELYFTMIFIICLYYLEIKNTLIIFYIGYIPSMIMMLYTIIKIWDSLDYFSKKIIINKESENIKERDNLININ